MEHNRPDAAYVGGGVPRAWARAARNWAPFMVDVMVMQAALGLELPETVP
jgi:hypothetical protein